MADEKEPKVNSEPRGRLVKEEVRRTRSDSSTRRNGRRRRRGVLFRGSLIEGVYQATLEGMVAATDALRTSVNNFVDRDREDRRGRNGRLGGVVSNCVDSGWDVYDGIVDIPRRSWNAYRDEIDAEDDDRDDDDQVTDKK